MSKSDQPIMENTMFELYYYLAWHCTLKIESDNLWYILQYLKVFKFNQWSFETVCPLVLHNCCKHCLKFICLFPMALQNLFDKELLQNKLFKAIWNALILVIKYRKANNNGNDSECKVIRALSLTKVLNKLLICIV